MPARLSPDPHPWQIIDQDYIRALRFNAGASCLAVFFLCKEGIGAVSESGRAEQAGTPTGGTLSYGALHDSFATFSFEWDPVTDLITRSAESIRILGLQPPVTEETGSGFLSRIHHEDRPRYEALLEGLSPDYPSYRIRYRYVRPGVGEVVLEEHGRALFDGAGHPNHLLGITADVTEHQEMARDLLHQRELLQGIIDHIPVMITIDQPDLRVFRVNREFERVLGWGADEFQGIHPFDRIFQDPDERKRALDVMASPESRWRDLRASARDGTPVHSSWANVRLSDGTRVGIGIDIRDRKRAEDTLLEADRNKDEFLAMLGHELRTPLAPIRSAVELIGLIDRDEPRLRRAAALIRRQCTHMTRLLDDLLDVSRIAQGKLELQLEPVLLRSVMRQALELAGPRIDERRHQLEVRLPPASVCLNGDPVRLSQVFLNLLDNAAKYTEEGGRIRFEASVEGTEAVVSISDTGRGIPTQELPLVFEAFAQGCRRNKQSAAGLGMGLSIVQRLVQMHGGQVQADSPGLDQGSSFRVRLPVTPRSVPRGRPAAATVADPQSLRVLVVDDDPDIAESTALLLQAMGHEVDLAADVDEALDHARQQAHRLVLLDLGLRDRDGFEVAHRLRGLPQGRDLNIAAVTGYDDEKTRARSREAGIDYHLLKPLGLSALRDLLTAIAPRHDPKSLD